MPLEELDELDDTEPLDELEEEDDDDVPQKSASGSNETPLSQTEIQESKNTLHVGVPCPTGHLGVPELH